MGPDEQLAQCDREIAQCADYDGPDLVGAAMGWADWSVEKELILQELPENNTESTISIPLVIGKI